MKASLFVSLLFLVSFPSYCSAWTRSEWVGVIEAVAGASVLSPRTTPIPDNDECENCGGTGRLGDGTVSVVCPVCEGTGKPVKPGVYETSGKDCQSCQIPDRIKSDPTPPGMEAPDLKQDAKSSSGGTYNPRLFRRRR